MAHESIIRVIVESLADIHKKELEHELAIKDAYFQSFKKEILEQLTTVRAKVIELQKKQAKSELLTDIAEL